MVYAALRLMEIPAPPFEDGWYEMPRTGYLRALLKWGKRVDGAPYDGDVLLLAGQRPMFGVVWQHGAMHINPVSELVSWCPIAQLGSHWRLRYCLMKES